MSMFLRHIRDGGESRDNGSGARLQRMLTIFSMKSTTI